MLTLSFQLLPTSTRIVLFDNNGPDLNLLDPFHLRFRRFSFQAQILLQICAFSEEEQLPEDVSVALQPASPSKSLSYALKSDSEELLTSKDRKNQKIYERANGQVNLGELPLDGASVSDHPFVRICCGG